MTVDEAMRVIRNRCWNPKDPEAAAAYTVIASLLDWEDED